MAVMLIFHADVLKAHKTRKLCTASLAPEAVWRLRPRLSEAKRLWPPSESPDRSSSSAVAAPATPCRATAASQRRIRLGTGWDPAELQEAQPRGTLTSDLGA